MSCFVTLFRQRRYLADRYARSTPIVRSSLSTARSVALTNKAEDDFGIVCYAKNNQENMTFLSFTSKKGILIKILLAAGDLPSTDNKVITPQITELLRGHFIKMAVLAGGCDISKQLPTCPLLGKSNRYSIFKQFSCLKQTLDQKRSFIWSDFHKTVFVSNHCELAKNMHISYLVPYLSLLRPRYL